MASRSRCNAALIVLLLYHEVRPASPSSSPSRVVLVPAERRSIHGLVRALVLASHKHSLTLGAPRLPRERAVEVKNNAESLLGAVSLVALPLGDRSQQCAPLTTLSAAAAAADLTPNNGS